MPDKTILVAGDVCIDVIGVPQPRPSAAAYARTENWRLTGEIRTHHTRGGSLLLAEMLKAACGGATVLGQELQTPLALRCGGKDGPLGMEMYKRLSRDEIVHSVIRADLFKSSADAKKNDKTLRVEHTEGFSGPPAEQPSLKTIRPESAEASIVVLDDTGNNFRNSPDAWPAVIDAPGGALPMVVYKLHRPVLPRPGAQNRLWETVATKHTQRRVVVLSVEDLRAEDASISRGLSWERTALDLVWHLRNHPQWEALRKTPHLIVRLGLDGALYWRYDAAIEENEKAMEENKKKGPFTARLIYSPEGIEGSWESRFEGRMVGYGSAFVAGLVKAFADAGGAGGQAEATIEEALKQSPELALSAIQAGLIASRRLLESGLGKPGAEPGYCRADLFSSTEKGDKDHFFASQCIPIISEAAVPDRGYWRLIDSIFSGQTSRLHRAANLLAREENIDALAAEKVKKDKARKQGSDDVITEDEHTAWLLKQVPVAVFAKALRAYDRREIESYRALYSLMFDYLEQTRPNRPLSVAVFGPPGAGKSFGVKMVAKALETSGGRQIETLTFNLSQFKEPEELAAAFHLVRDAVLRGRVPLVFFDEFDTALGDKKLGWLRYFLGPMQDAEFIDRGLPHPIGPSIFVFAGGTCGSYAEFAKHCFEKDTDEARAFRDAKGKDFLSRLRGTLDIPGLDLETEFDAYGPAEALPCEASILLRRANILAHQLGEKASRLRDATNALDVSDPVLRALLHLPKFVHGNRSFEALLDMSHLVGVERFTPSLMPASGHTALHACAAHLRQLLATDYPYPAADRELIAQAIHAEYIAEQKRNGNYVSSNENMRDWGDLGEGYRESNRQQADHIATKLRTVGLWFRKSVEGLPPAKEAEEFLQSKVDDLARIEHDRWVAERRRAGWIPASGLDASCRKNIQLLHNYLFRWEYLTEKIKDLDRIAVKLIPEYLKAAGYEVFEPLDSETELPDRKPGDGGKTFLRRRLVGSLAFGRRSRKS